MGILYGISGQLFEAKSYLRKVTKEKCEYDYEVERQQLATRIITWLSDHDMFIEKVKPLINKTRQMKKLPPSDLRSLFSLREKKTRHSSVFTIWRQLFGK